MKYNLLTFIFLRVLKKIWGRGSDEEVYKNLVLSTELIM